MRKDIAFKTEDGVTLRGWHREGRAAQEESSHYGRSDVPAPRTSSNRRSLF